MKKRLLAILILIISLVTINKIESSSQVSSEDYREYQWYLEEFSEAYELLNGYNNEVTIAIIDSGINFLHQDLLGASVDGYNFRENNYWWMDIHGHGTSLSGLIASNSDDNVGIDGIAGNLPIKILPIRVSSKGSDAHSSDIIRGLRYAIDCGVDVINLSFTEQLYSEVENQLIQEAIGKGIVVVASVGNDGMFKEYFPASYEGVIGVGSVDLNNKLSDFSNMGSVVDIVAPGEDLYLPTTGNRYEIFEGTSYSAAYISGVIGLAKCINPNLDSEDILELFAKTSKDLGDKGYDTSFGYGRVQVYEFIADILGGSLPKVLAIESASFTQENYFVQVGQELEVPQFSIVPKSIPFSKLHIESDELSVDETIQINKQGTYKIFLKDDNGVIYDEAFVTGISMGKMEQNTINSAKKNVYSYDLFDSMSKGKVIENSFVVDENGQLVDCVFSISNNGFRALARIIDPIEPGMKYKIVINNGELINEVVHTIYTEYEDSHNLNLRVHSVGEDFISVDWDEGAGINEYHLYYSDEPDGYYYPFLDQHGYKAIFPKIEIYGVKNYGMEPGKERYYMLYPITKNISPYETIVGDPSGIIGYRTHRNKYIERMKSIIPEDYNWIYENLKNITWELYDSSLTTISVSGVGLRDNRVVNYEFVYEVDFDGKTTIEKAKNLLISRKVFINSKEVILNVRNDND